jgi:hypothetical protein
MVSSPRLVKACPTPATTQRAHRTGSWKERKDFALASRVCTCSISSATKMPSIVNTIECYRVHEISCPHIVMISSSPPQFRRHEPLNCPSVAPCGPRAAASGRPTRQSSVSKQTLPSRRRRLIPRVGDYAPSMPIDYRCLFLTGYRSVEGTSVVLDENPSRHAMSCHCWAAPQQASYAQPLHKVHEYCNHLLARANELRARHSRRGAKRYKETSIPGQLPHHVMLVALRDMHLNECFSDGCSARKFVVPRCRQSNERVVLPI